MHAGHPWDAGEVRALVANRDAGGLIRLARTRRGWRQADLGRRIGCSASTVSRLEQRGGRADLDLVLRAAREAGVPHHVLAASLGLTDARSTIVAPESPRCAEEDPMRRRTLLAAAGLAAPGGLVAGVENALAITPDPTGSAVSFDSRLAAARRLYDGGRNSLLLAEMPGLLADAHAASGNRQDISFARLSATYSLAAQGLIKIGRYDQARLAADRAAVYAEMSGSPLVSAAAARELSIVLRHQDQPTAAQRHILTAVSRVEATGLRNEAQRSAYAQMLCTTAYTKACAGEREEALTMIREATRAARDLPHGSPEGRLFQVTPAAVDLYSVSVNWALGDAGSALEAGRRLQPGQFGTAERKGRMHTELGRAWWQWGKPEQAATELLAAVRVSPGEVRDRPAIRRIVAELGSRHPRVTGVGQLVAVAGLRA
ncbi:helix-turn-helix domain-containing protein [Streptomyces zhihengii]|uniref:helix-turn-helix domain-containing protein n=1 Tax=Streptomyces zhihengii TaxID=1818004 RepID=UPI0036BE9448